MCVCVVCVCVHVKGEVCVCVCVYIWRCVCMCVHMEVCVCVYMWRCVCMCVHVEGRCVYMWRGSECALCSVVIDSHKQNNYELNSHLKVQSLMVTLLIASNCSGRQQSSNVIPSITTNLDPVTLLLSNARGLPSTTA